MTVIAWDGTTLAADKQADFGGIGRTVTKIFKTEYGLIGVSGDLTFGLALVDWIKNGMIKEDYPQHQKDKDDWQSVIFITIDGAIQSFERSPYPITFTDKFHAIGSGRDFAMAAMECGKTAEEAVNIASNLCLSCGNGVDTLTLDK